MHGIRLKSMKGNENSIKTVSMRDKALCKHIEHGTTLAESGPLRSTCIDQMSAVATFAFGSRRWACGVDADGHIRVTEIVVPLSPDDLIHKTLLLTNRLDSLRKRIDCGPPANTAKGWTPRLYNWRLAKSLSFVQATLRLILPRPRSSSHTRRLRTLNRCSTLCF